MTTAEPTPLAVPVLTRWNLHEFDPAEASARGAVLLVDKPRGWTSFDVVAKTRNLLRVKKIGHTGTLDPMATGLLILCMGKATKLVEQLQSQSKEYTGAIRLGAETATDDADGEIAGEFPMEHITESMIYQAAQSFLGTSLQSPPMFSARKVDGQRLYKLARRGQQVEVAPRQIQIDAFEIVAILPPEIRFRIVCSKGTYIRSIARDLGRMLHSGAHLCQLRRTASGDHSVEDAVGMEDLNELAESKQ